MLKTRFFLFFLVPLFLSQPMVFAFNSEAKERLLTLFEKNQVASDVELFEILLVIAGDESLSHSQKVSDMDYVVHISGHRLAKRARRALFDNVFMQLEVRRREAYIQNHPELDENTKEAIQKSRIFVGMTKEQVEASLGGPEEVRPVMGSVSDKEKWFYYSKRMTVFFEEDQLISIKKM